MNIAKAFRSRREAARTRRALDRAILGAGPALRDELLVAAQRQTGLNR